MPGGHTSRLAMRIGACTIEQMMFAHVFLVCLDNVLVMIGMIDFDAVNGDLGAQLVEQERIIKRKTALTSAWMGNQAHSTATMSSLDRLRHIGHNRIETSFFNHRQSLSYAGSIIMLEQQRGIVDRTPQLSTSLCKDFLLTRKF